MVGFSRVGTDAMTTAFLAMTRFASRLGLGGAVAVLAYVALIPPVFADKAHNSVRFTYYATLDSADPYFTNSRLALIISDSVWDTLIFRDPATGEFEGNLATDWRWIDDLTLELDLRRGVRFHNGAELGADDVVYTLNFVANPDNKAVDLSQWRWIERVEKVDAYRVRIVTKGPTPAAIATLASPGAAIYPHEYYAQVEPDGMSARPIGSGPFRVAEHVRGKHIWLDRNPGYRTDGPKPRARLDRVEIRFIPDAQTRTAEMVARGNDLDMYVARDQPEQLQDIPHLQIVSGDTNNWLFHAVTWFGWTSWCAAISATVFSPRIASKATRALNAGEWLRLGFLMDFVPPVSLWPGPKSTYTRVRKTGATSTGGGARRSHAHAAGGLRWR
jgi:peptide/nickel transport system substrate-binding protein